MKKKVVFISSTVYDLKLERQAIYDLLESNYYIPLASEQVNFDIGDGKLHSYDICYDNVETSDIVIAILGFRLGGVTEYDGKKVSITMAEILHALKKKKVVYIFSPQSLSDERFTFIDESKFYPSRKEAFKSLSKKYQADSYLVYENLNLITKLPINNWISFYSDFDNLIIRVKSKLAGYNLDILQNTGVNYTGVVDLLKKGTDFELDFYDPSFDQNRKTSLKILKLLDPFLGHKFLNYDNLSNSLLFSKLKSLYKDNTHFANQTGMQSAEMCIHQKGKLFYGFDTQMEQNAINIWMKDLSFQRYLYFTKSCAKKEKDKHYRVFLFENLAFIKENRFEIYQSILIHINSGIIPIVTLYSLVPYDIPYNMMNCNALYKDRVLIVMLPVGLTMMFTAKNSPSRLKLYDESFAYILSRAQIEQDAVMFNSHISFIDFVAKINSIDDQIKLVG